MTWQDQHITVAGLGVSGISAARALAGLGAHVTVVDGGESEQHLARAAQLAAAFDAPDTPGTVTVRLGDADTLPEPTDLVVTSPGWAPDSPLFAAAAAVGVEVWGDVEL
ncbi:UDP-N-acetylmuramoyl-L-alanyl-D-glutamate synthetase, partial [Streptomyces sp. NRRL WC-3753]